MSDSIPKKIPANAEPASSPKRRAERKVIPIWWIMSAAFHTLVIGWLVFFSPIRVINLERVKAEFTAGTEKIQEVMDQVRVVQAEKLSEDVLTLQEIQRELQELEASKQQEFANFAAEFTTNAPSLAEHDQAVAAQAQAEALAAQKEAATALTKAQQSKSKDDVQAASPPQGNAVGAQGRADQPMERALQDLAMSDSTFDAARKAQADANELQGKAEKAQLDANDMRENAPWARQNAEQKQRAVAQAQDSIKKAETDAATAKENVAKVQADAAAAQNEIQQLKTEATTERTEADKLKADAAQAKADYEKVTGKGEDKKAAHEVSTRAQDAARKAVVAANTAEGKIATAQSKADSLQHKAERAAASVASAETRVATARAKAEQAQSEATQAAAKADAQEAKMVQVQEAAKALQADALDAQTKARIALANARLSAATNTLAAMTNMPPIMVTATSPALPDVSGMNLADLYQTAVGTEGELTEIYKKIRATELAMLRQIPLQRAMELTEVAKAVRPDLKKALQAKPASGEDVPALREAVQTAGSEINAMVNLGASMLMQAKGLNRGGSKSEEGATITLADIKAMSAQAATMEGLAAEDENQNAKDLSGAMQAGAKLAGQGAAAGGGLKGPGPKGKEGGMPGYGSGPPPMPKNMKAIPGRKINSASPSTGWLFVDSWYVIGPFDNARRENIEKKFPPETVVDLNATYLGKDNQPIRWEFYQSPEAMVAPPFDHYKPYLKKHDYELDYEARGLEYIIYYAYTELYFEQACDLWVAVGSDDYSKIWIEDQLIWSSGKQLKSWRADEGFRKIHFKQGINRVLCRVENGWHGTQFSLVLSLK